jgi:hypothetical protein
LVFYLFSRLGPLPYNPARHPAFIKAPRLLGSVPSYLLVLVVATADPRLPSLPRASIPQARHLQCWRCTLSYPSCLPPGKYLPKLRHLPGLSFLLSASFPLAYEVHSASSTMTLSEPRESLYLRFLSLRRSIRIPRRYRPLRPRSGSSRRLIAGGRPTITRTSG